MRAIRATSGIRDSERANSRIVPKVEKESAKLKSCTICKLSSLERKMPAPQDDNVGAGLLVLAGPASAHGRAS